eukprot:COSAG01_NODE_1317_length_10750_cov_1.790536_15_plen_40_part_00
METAGQGLYTSVALTAEISLQVSERARPQHGRKPPDDSS